MNERFRQTEWLKAHAKADAIVTDANGVPQWAEYRTLSNGMYPVAFAYPYGAWNIYAR